MTRGRRDCGRVLLGVNNCSCHSYSSLMTARTETRLLRVRRSIRPSRINRKEEHHDQDQESSNSSVISLYYNLQHLSRETCSFYLLSRYLRRKCTKRTTVRSRRSTQEEVHQVFQQTSTVERDFTTRIVNQHQNLPR